MFPGEDRWYFSREEIDNNSPSRRDGIDLTEETRLRKAYCSFLKDLGRRFKLHQATVATAMVFCHRFFLCQSHAKNDKSVSLVGPCRDQALLIFGLNKSAFDNVVSSDAFCLLTLSLQIIAAVCMFLSAKVESTPVDLKTLIITSEEILHKKVIAAEQRQGVYEHYKGLVSNGEKLVLSTLNFDLSVDLPFDILIQAMKKFILVEATQGKFPSAAWKFVQDSFWTTLCLQYQPRHIAAGAFFLAAMHIKMDVKSHGESWCQHFDITLHQLNDIRGQMGELYHGKKRTPTSTGSIGETSNTGDVVQQQPVPTDNCPSSVIEGGSSSVADGSLQDQSRPEGVEKDSPDREAGDNQEDS
ncbi:cyclin-T1-2 isoform X1 [Brassica napus]|uniref:cyclin-T1-2 isoform X1 n=1 Tax=Brassica napus TaxID=3708 RepID=UPI002078BEC3|nr:cyclin-T1-2 isoform X1 [Brassica napus]XP_048602257.1 cyclin-T1-2 isoform X1 [Brassica napus]